LKENSELEAVMRMFPHRIGAGGLSTIVLFALVGATAAQQGQQEAQTLPPSTNPAQRV
jgi:hypothetical protein